MQLTKEIEEIIEFLEKNKDRMISGELGLMFKFLEVEYIAEFIEEETEQYIFQKKCSSASGFANFFFILERSNNFVEFLEKIKKYLENKIEL